MKRRNIHPRKSSRTKAKREHIILRADIRDFSHVEDSKDAFKTISSIVLRAGRFAAAEARAAGLSTIFARDNRIILLGADGKESVVSNANRPESLYVEYPTTKVFYVSK